MLKSEFTSQFRRDYKLAVKRGCNPARLQEVVTTPLLIPEITRE